MANKLSNLSERELLILLNEKVERLESEMSGQRSIAAEIKALEMRVLTQEVKWRTWSIIFGAGAGIISSLITKFLHL
jgi:hypothetical protein